MELPGSQRRSNVTLQSWQDFDYSWSFGRWIEGITNPRTFILMWLLRSLCKLDIEKFRFTVLFISNNEGQVMFKIWFKIIKIIDNSLFFRVVSVCNIQYVSKHQRLKNLAKKSIVKKSIYSYIELWRSNKTSCSRSSRVK